MEIASLGEFGLIEHLTKDIKPQNTIQFALIANRSKTLTSNGCTDNSGNTTRFTDSYFFITFFRALKLDSSMRNKSEMCFECKARLTGVD